MPNDAGARGPVMRRVKPGRALDWLAAGWAYFMRMPRQAMLATCMLLGATLLLALLGSARLASVLSHLLVPLYSAYLFTSCRALDADGSVPRDYARLYRNVSLWILGGIGAAIALALDLLGNTAATGWFAHSGHGLLGLYFVANKLLWLVATMALWLAPALIVFHGASPLRAMKLSLLGTLKNLLPWLLFGVLAFVFCIVAAIPVGLGLLVALPTLACGAYIASGDIFV